MHDQFWSWVLTAVGITGFIFVGRKEWWAWYINFFCQFLWIWYAVVTQQWGFIVAALIYMVVFGRNAVKWTEDWRKAKKTKNVLANPADYPEGTLLVGSQVILPGEPLPWGGVNTLPPPVVTRSWDDRSLEEFKVELKPPPVPTLSEENKARLQELNRRRLQGL